MNFQNTPNRSFAAALKRPRRWVSPVILVIFLAGIWVSGRKSPTSRDIPIDAVRRLFPQAAELTGADDGAVALDARGRLIGRVVRTSEHIEKTKSGYAGPVPLIVGFGSDGRVTGVALLENREDFSFVQEIIDQGMIDSWTGLDPVTALGKRVDAVSGATFSSDAIVVGVHDVLGRNAAHDAVPAALTRGRAYSTSCITGFAVLAFCLLCFLRPRLFAKARTIQLVLSVGILGFWCGALISLDLTAAWLRTPRTGLTAPLVLVPVLLTAALGILLGRNLYCTHVCPYGCAQELATRLIRVKRRPIPRRAVLFMRVFRGALLLGVAAAMLFGQNAELGLIEPFAAFKFQAAHWLPILLAVVFLGLSVRFPRLWCRTVCPTGLVLGMLCPPRRRLRSGWATPGQPWCPGDGA